MSALDHWHPVLLSEELGSKPVAVSLAGQQLVLFRTSASVGVLDDLCPHRRMRLSYGKVVGNKLQCKYHGWCFDTQGAGESPGTPKMHASAGCYDACEDQGAIWVKSRASHPRFPVFARDDMELMCRMRHVVPAPLELTMDNFCEIEHTPTTHQYFGYPLDRMHEVTVRVDSDEQSTHVAIVGPARHLPVWMRVLMGTHKGYVFNDDWKSYFSPCYGIYDHWFSNPLTGRRSLLSWRNVHFFWAIDERSTGMATWSFCQLSYLPNFLLKPFRSLWQKMLDREIKLDIEVIGGLGSLDTSLEGMKLSRFDKVLALNRERIERVYRGNGARPDEVTPKQALPLAV